MPPKRRIAATAAAGDLPAVAVSDPRPGGRDQAAVVATGDDLVADAHDLAADDDPARFVGNALSPAQVSSVAVVDAAAKAARVVVPDFQLSLAIGREGQNARLAARLTGWRIDIRPDNEPVSHSSADRAGEVG